MDELQVRREFIAGTRFEGLRLEGWNGEVSKPTWFLDKLIPGRSIGMVYGPSNSGKTHLVVDMAMHAVTEQSWCGMKLDKGPIVVFAESIGNFQNRDLEKYLLNEEVMTANGIIAIMHHTSKASGGMSARGASALEGNIDWSVRVEFNKELESTVAHWSKDRWRMIDKPPAWLAKRYPQIVNFADGPESMNIHEWVFFDPDEEAAEAELEREKEIEGSIDEMSKALSEMVTAIGYAFIPNTAKRDVRSEFKAGVVMPSKFANAHNAKAVKAYYVDGKSTFNVEPKYNQGGVVIGYYLTR
jgi:hypothetical protein